VGLREILADTRPLRTPAFRRLWTANIVTVVGAQLTVVAVPAQIYSITGSSGWVGLTGLFGLVPLVVFGLWGGALADHFDRRRILLVTTTGLIATSGLFWLQAALALGNVWVLLGLFALQQAFFAVNQPTRTAVLPRILPNSELAAANALNMTVMQAGAIAGPLVGGALIPVLGFAWLYFVDTITLFATLWAVWTLPPLPVEGVSARAPGLRAVWDGLLYLRGHQVLMVAMLVDVIAMVFGMPRALFPEMAHLAFGGPSEGGLAFALLFAAIPTGAVLGGVFGGWVSRIRRQGMTITWLIVAWGAAMAAVGVAVGVAEGWGSALAVPMLVIALVALMAGGAIDMASAALRQSLLLGAADDQVRGRLQGVFLVAVVGGPRIADVIHGGAGDLWGSGPATAGGGLLVIIVTLLVVMAWPRFYRFRMDADTNPG
jgi:MFS family permease